MDLLVLSGFVIAFSLRRDRMTLGYIGLLALRRSIRLDPPYWVGIITMLAVMVVRNSATHARVDRPSGMQLLAHLLYLQEILGYGSINVVLWTLCIEIQFYLLTCVILWALQSLCRLVRIPELKANTAFVALFVVALVWRLKVHYPGKASVWFPPYYFAFLVGRSLLVEHWRTDAAMDRLGRRGCDMDCLSHW